MLLLSLIGAAVTFILGEAILASLVFLPSIIQCALYLLVALSVCGVVMLASEKLKSGSYLLKHRREFASTALQASLIVLPCAFALGLITQWLYGLAGPPNITKPDFQGSMIVCDISGSMQTSDPDKDTVDSIMTYLETVPLGEYVGIILFNHSTTLLREYTPLIDEDEREELIRLVSDAVEYDGGTDINTALIEAISEVRSLENKDWPGLVLFFSDGDSSIDYSYIQTISIGDPGNSRNRVPVNAIYFSKSRYSGAHMERIADDTGGIFIHVGFDDYRGLRDVFRRSRSEFRLNTKLHLLKYNISPEDRSAFKVFLRALLLALWGALSGIYVALYLNNNRLFKHFLLPKFIAAIVVGVVFTAIIYNAGVGTGGMFARALLALNLCVIYIPSYRWD